jgi:hypothetical protein
MFEVLLNTARNNFVAHQREEEIQYLDIDPEEYVMLRDDKNPMGLELLKAILEKLKIPNWDVDEGTLRIVRISEAPGVRRNFSLAITSDTRRFHLKIYRDFEGELDELDMGSSRGICAAINQVEQTIYDIRERKIREAELRRLAAIEEEKRREREELENILLKVEQINTKCRSLYSKELSAAQIGEDLLSEARDYIVSKVARLPQNMISMPVNEIESVREKFEGKQFKIIDHVPCQFDEENSLIHVSNKFITNCIHGKNFISPVCSVVGYESESRSLVLTSVGESSSDSSHVASHQGLSARRLDRLRDPLEEAEKLLQIANDLNTNMKSDEAKISILSTSLQASSFEALRVSIDAELAYLAENVKLLVWNNQNVT